MFEHVRTLDTSEKNKAATNAERDSFSAARGTQLAENRSHVKFDGMLRDRQPYGDLLIR
jgi:hypothetical protein